MNLIRRGGVYYINRRVPTRYASVDGRSVVRVSLSTDSESIARVKAALVWAHLIEGWEARLHGNNSDAAVQFDAARELAQVRGFRYLNQVVRLPDLPEKVEPLKGK